MNKIVFIINNHGNHNNIVFIINNHGNHNNIVHLGGGASELLFFRTAFELSKYYNVSIINRDTPSIIDNIQYLYLPDNFNIDIHDSIVIVQRHFNIVVDLHKKYPSNKYILWSHDYLENTFVHLTGNYSPKEIDALSQEAHIDIVAVSNFHKNNILSKLPNANVHVIYNALFGDLYVKNDANVDYNNVVFASNWAKGLNNVIKIGTECYRRNKNFKLLLLKPSYCEWEPVFSQPFIKIIGNIKDKNEYCKILQNSLCVLSTSYPETFGCVFAEALHLGVPVIGDNSINSGFHEIIQREHMCNFNNVNEVFGKIEEFRMNRPNVCLDNKFYDIAIIQEWVEIINTFNK